MDHVFNLNTSINSISVAWRLDMLTDLSQSGPLSGVRMVSSLSIIHAVHSGVPDRKGSKKNKFWKTTRILNTQECSQLRACQYSVDLYPLLPGVPGVHSCVSGVWGPLPHSADLDFRLVLFASVLHIRLLCKILFEEKAFPLLKGSLKPLFPH